MAKADGVRLAPWREGIILIPQVVITEFATLPEFHPCGPRVLCYDFPLKIRPFHKANACAPFGTGDCHAEL
jgi:hypothetical protein